jgi:integrase/recombinase XerD
MDDGVLQAFEQHQRVRGLARKTIDRRRYSLRKLQAFAAPVPVLEVTATLIEDWLGTYRRAETRHAYLGDVRALFKWARKRNLVTVDPTEDMDPIRIPRRLPRPMEEDDLALAVATARDPRLRLVLLLGAFAGLRCFEIAQLRGEDCTKGWLVVRGGKGGKDATVPMHPFLWSAIEAHGVEHGWVFDSPHGGHIAPATIGSWIRKHFAEVGIVGSLHRTRHRFGTRIAEAAGGNMLVVKELMRHANLETSQGYVAFDSSRLQPFVNGLPVMV